MQQNISISSRHIVSKNKHTPANLLSHKMISQMICAHLGNFSMLRNPSVPHVAILSNYTFLFPRNKNNLPINIPLWEAETTLYHIFPNYFKLFVKVTSFTRTVQRVSRIAYILYLCRGHPGIPQGPESRVAHEHFYERVGSEE